MSKLKVDTLETINGLESETLSNILKRLPTAWASWIPNTNVILDSYNISSIIRSGVGTYDLLFAVPMDNTDYAYVITASQPNVLITGYETLIASTVNGIYIVGVAANAGTVFDATTRASIVFYGGKN